MIICGIHVDLDKVDDTLEVTEFTQSDVYEIEVREYVKKAKVDEDIKESRLQGLKDRLAASERIEELTEFQPSSGYHTRSMSG